MDVPNSYLQIIDYLHDQLGEISVFLDVVLRFLSLLSEVAHYSLANLFNFFFALLDYLGVFAVPLGDGYFCDDELKPLEEDFYFAGSQALPGNIHF